MSKPLMPDDMRDWPERLRVNIAALDLAVALHNSRSGVYGPRIAFDELTNAIKRAYIECASRIIRELKPRRPTEGILPAELADVARQSLRVVR